MSYNGRGTLILIVLISLLAGCSTGDIPVLPQFPGPSNADTTLDSRDATLCLGVWQVIINQETGEIDAAKLRGPDGALNVLGFMEPPPMQNLRIDFGSLVLKPQEKTVQVDVILTHPLVTGTNLYDGYDVRGVVFGPDLLNADGQTRWFNPREFSTVPFGYADGLLGAKDSFAKYTDVYNGFKYYVSDIGFDEGVKEFLDSPANLDNRGVFSEGDTVVRRYMLSWVGKNPPMDFLVFNYAVYANYEFPTGSPPYGLDDFTISANSIEAIYANPVAINNSLFYNSLTGTGGGSVELEIEVFDWQGCGPGYMVSIESTEPDVIEETVGTFEYTTGPYSSVFSVVADGEPTSFVDLEILVKCSDSATYGETYFLGMMPSSQFLYDKPIEIWFQHKLPVEAIEAGLNYASSGELPDPLPTTNLKDFSVIASATANEGVYYYTTVDPPSHPGDNQGEAIFFYPTDYSTDGTQYYDIYNPFGYDDYDLWGNVEDLGAIDMPAIGSGIIISTSTSPGGIPPYLHRDYAFWYKQYGSPPVPPPGLVNGIFSECSYGALKWVDTGADYKLGVTGSAYALAITDDLMGAQCPPVQTEVGFITIYSPYGVSNFVFNNRMFLKDNIGDVDGKVDNTYTTKIGVDGDPKGTAHGTSNTVIYILESDPTPDIEVFEFNRLWQADSGQTYYGTTIHGFSDPPTMPIDLECFPAYKLGFCDDWNWVAVLEDNEDGTWQVSLWQQDGTFVDRTSSLDGAPMHLDIDATSGEIHVWYEVGSTLMWAKFEYSE
jgi:hypothetical protein